MATIAMMNVEHSALEVTRNGGVLRIFVNPEYAELFPSTTLRRTIGYTLLSAAATIEEGEDFSFTHSPHHDFYLHVTVNNEGAVKINGEGAEQLNREEVTNFLQNVATTYLSKA